MVDELERVNMSELDLSGLEIKDESVQDGGDPPADTDKGQKPDSPPGDDKGQKPDSPPDDKGVKEDEKPAPYDQDPKWKAARAAEKSLIGILEKHGFESVADLESAISKGQDLQDLIGERDANQVIEDSDTLVKYKAYWADQKRQEQEQNETPEETIVRLKRENAEIVTKSKEEEEKKSHIDKSRKALEGYNSEVTRVLKTAESVSDMERELIQGLMGVDNPAMDIAITDTENVEKIAKAHTQKVTKMVAKIKQEAIDEYAKGKSKLTPVKEKDAEIPASPAMRVIREPLPDNASVEDVFHRANQELLEIIMKGG